MALCGKAGVTLTLDASEAHLLSALLRNVKGRGDARETLNGVKMALLEGAEIDPDSSEYEGAIDGLKESNIRVTAFGADRD